MVRPNRPTSTVQQEQFIKPEKTGEITKKITRKTTLKNRNQTDQKLPHVHSCLPLDSLDFSLKDQIYFPQVFLSSFLSFSSLVLGVLKKIGMEEN